MGFIGVQPTTVPLTASDITDGIISNAKLGADSVNSSKISNDSISEEHIDNTAITGFSALTSLADTDKFLVSDASDSNNLKYVEKQYLGGGGTLELISRSVNDDSGTSGGISFTGVFTTAYRYYMLYIGKVAVGTNNADLQVRFMDNSNNSLTGGYYNRGGEYNDVGNNSVGTLRAQGSSAFILGASSHNADNTPTQGSFFIYNSTHTTTNDRPCIIGTGLWHHEAQHDARMFYFGGSYVGGHHCAGLRIETSSGDISDHDFAIFGIKAY